MFNKFILRFDKVYPNINLDRHKDIFGPDVSLLCVNGRLLENSGQIINIKINPNAVELVHRIGARRSNNPSYSECIFVYLSSNTIEVAPGIIGIESTETNNYWDYLDDYYSRQIRQHSRGVPSFIPFNQYNRHKMANQSMDMQQYDYGRRRQREREEYEYHKRQAMMNNQVRGMGSMHDHIDGLMGIPSHLLRNPFSKDERSIKVDIKQETNPDLPLIVKSDKEVKKFNLKINF